MKKIIIILFLTLLFNVSSPGSNIVPTRLKHYIEYTQTVNKKESEEEFLKKKIILYSQLYRLQIKVDIINFNYSLTDTS